MGKHYCCVLFKNICGGIKLERTSIFYKLRRKIQIVAYGLFSNETLSKLYYQIVLKKPLNIHNPQSFNEKLQWLKLYYFPYNQLTIQCSDKYTVRDYIKSKGYENLLVPLIGAWKTSKEIEWDRLPNKFVLKCSHGCAYNIVCVDKDNFSNKSAIKQLNKWLKEDFGAFNIEPHYSAIKQHMIICEEYLGTEIVDYKFFCFNGIIKFMYVSYDLLHDRQAKIGFFNLDGSKMALTRDDYVDIQNIDLPPFFEEMKKTAADLCKDFPFVRVDFFLANNRYYFAELTFTPGACMMPFNPKEYDNKLGNELDISKLININN